MSRIQYPLCVKFLIFFDWAATQTAGKIEKNRCFHQYEAIQENEILLKII